MKWIVLVALLVSVETFAWKKTADRPYVKSYLDGSFYVKAVPDPSAKTMVLAVRKEADEPVDAYDWYDGNARRIELAWSPIAGKIALMHLKVDDTGYPNKPRAVQELSFYLGGKKVRTLNRKDLSSLKVPDSISRSQDILLSSRQVPGTNDYLFVMALPDGNKIEFDILSGALKRDQK
jgi:hypothetical protein